MHERSERIEFRNFSAILALTEHGKDVTSGPVIHAENCAFSVVLFPNGTNEVYTMTLRIRRTDSSRKRVCCAYTISIMGAGGKVVDTMSQEQPEVFNPEIGKGWSGWEARPCFYASENDLKAAYSARMKAFRDKGYIVNDVLNVNVSLRLFLGSPQSLSSASLCVQDGIAKLASDVGHMMEDAPTSDISLVCRDGLTYSHRFILAARSPVFRAMFASNMRESSSGEVRLPDMARATVHHFLHYIYHGSLPDGLQDAELWALIALAHKYEVTALIAECSSTLESKLNPENAAAMFSESDMLNVECLKNAALDFMLRDSGTFEEVQSSAAFTALPARLVKELLARAMGARKRDRPVESYEFPDGTQWAALTVARLKLALAERALPTTGPKTQLVTRLQASCSSAVSSASSG